ncbi:DUF2325 domain-containing protein [Variovorax sp. E3]|uniref:DUF2325 domain-containing protein n=1 Tax=Variovorax sp. E3 TaxID=1914993 RepID=UPI0022B5EC6E|nr:DUF2325 domain-containing protein [Variovorax sp. E3]
MNRPVFRAVVACCEPAEEPMDSAQGAVPDGRVRLFDLDTNFFCSVIGTCLATSELRKLMARHGAAPDASDLEIHHDAVQLAAHNAGVARSLQKALDHRHAPVIQRASKIHAAAELAAFWEEALRQGEIPGAYWAVLMHRKATAELRQRVFGDVHMLSHLVGAANRADIRRLVALERENAELRERLERQQLRSHELTEERDGAAAKLAQALIHSAANARAMPLSPDEPDEPEMAARARQEESERAASLIAVQTGRRERAEQAAVAAVAEADRLAQELAHLREHAIALGRELAAAEAQLKRNAGEAAPSAYLDSQLQGRRILYVGGRPSSMPAIRDLVLRHGGEFQRHGGRLEDRSGLLASAVSWADVVVFPVDCIDHESVDNLKRVCVRQQVRYVPLRSAGIGCFAAAFPARPPTKRMRRPRRRAARSAGATAEKRTRHAGNHGPGATARRLHPRGARAARQARPRAHAGAVLFGPARGAGRQLCGRAARRSARCLRPVGAAAL